MNHKISQNQQIAVFLIFLLFVYSCKKESEIKTERAIGSGKINLVFAHHVNGIPMITDTMQYVNTAGNQYLISEIQYFISDLTFIRSDGENITVKDWEDIHYIDTDIASTQLWEIYDDIPEGIYDSIRFTFGINAEKNKSFMYVNPPERDMFWPEFLGGGYHYLKLNGKWLDSLNRISPFDFHLGIGQIYAGGLPTVDSITGFVQNYFKVVLPNSAFQLSKGQLIEIQIVMNIESWFETPHIYNHNVWLGYIMQNQQAMQLAKENGKDVFSIGYIQ